MKTQWGLATGLLLTVSSLASTRAADRPNIVFILADDLGWDDVSFHGSNQIPTPSLDQLAYDGIMLNTYYVQPICTPSRAALLTAKHPIHLGLQRGVIMGSEAFALSLKEKLLPQYLKTLGYDTHMVGKWHIGYMAEEYTPIYRGFDSHYGYYGGCDDYWDHTYKHGSDKNWGLDFWHNAKPEKTAFGQYSTHMFTKRAEEIIHNHDTSKPLFLYLPHQAPHNGNGPSLNTSQQAPQNYIDRFDYIQDPHRRTFAAMVSVLDESVGNVSRALWEKGMLNNTIIAFSTDNGGPANGFSLNTACNQPLRGMKYTLWEGGVRGNGFLWSPLLKKSGYTSDHMMQIFDWLPTLLNPAGYDLSTLPADLDGMDLWQTLSERKPSSPRTEMLHNIDPGEDNFALRQGDLKIKSGGDNGHDGWYPQPAVQPDVDDLEEVIRIRSSSAWSSAQLARGRMRKMLHSIGRPAPDGSPAVVHCGPRPENYTTNCQPKKSPCVFNITADPCEYTNLAPSRPDLLKQLLARVQAYNATALEPRNKPLDSRGLPRYHNGIWAPWMNASEALDIERSHDPDFSWDSLKIV